jgi:hypothetical protein
VEAMNMSLTIHWAEQAAAEAELAIQNQDERDAAEVVIRLTELLYPFEFGSCALQALPQEWHLLLRETIRIQQGGTDGSLFASREQREDTAKAFAAYAIARCNARYGFFN